MMILFALDFLERDVLGGGLVTTSMSNLGLHRAIAGAGIAIVETDVGDRNVLIALEEKGWPFGGEQSGHLIFRNLAPTGDGQLTGLLLADLIVRRGPLAQQADAVWHRVPQELINVARDNYDDGAVHDLFDELSTTYGVDSDDVRLLIRPSGTEPVVRVMIEALNAEFVDDFSTRLANIFVA
jgi:phosphoglucosamine mutase